ncbi:hypothetical protein, conserved [Eimeria acervulina]|uniref:Gla domain-containing protein n=1 Tax=Eimeria acervulina TaxID=5801 RepID=U6GC41_EIMAC|nr:hypothetical protein, conserved [Eimeria acervulina]CDI76908.1 hypothetical protein, conserved [Eimeria acervulina]
MRIPVGGRRGFLSFVLLAVYGAETLRSSCLFVAAKREGGPQLLPSASVLSPPSAALLQERAAAAEEDVDDAGSGENDEEEEVCEAQEAMSSFLTQELEKLQDSSSAWAKFLSKLAEVKENKDVCMETGESSNKRICEHGESSSGAPQPLPCGGDAYEELISKYFQAKNCELSLAVTQTLMQNWVGHGDKEGIFDKLMFLYGKAMEYGNLDSDLYYVYQDAKGLLEELLQQAKDSVAAFHSSDIKSVFVKRRREMLGLLCALGRGTDAGALAADIVVTESVMVIRGDFEESAAAAVLAFAAAVDAFGAYPRMLLEEGGFLERAEKIHENYHKFRMNKLNGILTDIEATANAGEDSSGLMDLVPHRRHTRHHSSSSSSSSSSKDGSQAPGKDSAEAAAPVFLEGAAEQIAAAPTEGMPQIAAAAQQPGGAAAQPAPTPLLTATPPASTAGPGAAAPPVTAPPAAPVQQLQQQPQPAAAVPGVQPAVAAAPSQGAAAPGAATTVFSSGVSGSPAPLTTAPEAAQQPPPPPAAAPTSPAASPLPTDTSTAAPAASALPQQQPAGGAAAPPPPGKPSAPGAVGAAGAAGGEAEAAGEGHNSNHSIPIRDRIEDMVRSMKMFEVEDGAITYRPNLTTLERVVKAGYTDITDHVFVEAFMMLPQAFVVSTFKLISLLLPNPQVDFAEFYNSTLADDGTITEGFSGELPVNHKLLAERFSEAVDEAYKDTWREFFHDQDGINDIAQLQSPKPQQQLLQQQQQQAASQQTEAEEHVSALEQRGSGVVQPHSFVLTGAEEESSFKVAIVSTSDGFKTGDVEQFADVQAVNSMSLQALASSASFADVSLARLVLVSLGCVLSFWLL